MQLLELMERLKNKKSFNTPSASVSRIFEIYEKSGKNESGETPIFIKPNIEDKKIKKSIN